ncbi:MAG TPA: polysaccharide pyruvyl transferase family protein [Myxococcaceae bacterium]|nr:polysaccharide pyruvyl transferase family protein [Myxococcaceae bacterium]
MRSRSLLSSLDPWNGLSELRRSPGHMSATTITLLGNFGSHNLGNECTLQALNVNIRRLLGDASVNCVCADPSDTFERHHIPAVLISYRHARDFGARRRSSNRLLRLLRRVFIRVPLELLEWFRDFKALKGTGMLIMTGTGMLGDFGIRPLGLHYEILKWSVIARLRRARVLFLSVGAGPLDHPLSRVIVKAALSLADYRSYRDHFSRQYLATIGFDTSRDSVYPDLVFSLPGSLIPVSSPRAKTGRVVALGLMEYYGKDCDTEKGKVVYETYVEQVSQFAAWLLEQGYSLRLLIGDLAYDMHVRNDVYRSLRAKGIVLHPEQLTDERITSVEDLCRQLSLADVVVATRFHNLVLALMLGKPTIALSYHEKIRSLMEEAGLGKYCHDVGGMDVPKLIQQFLTLEEDADALRSSIKGKTQEYRHALDEQYRHVLRDLLPAPAPAVRRAAS